MKHATSRLLLAVLGLLIGTVTVAADSLPPATVPSKLQWIWAGPGADKAETIVLETSFSLEKKPTNGRVRVMARAGCSVSINGESIGEQTEIKRPKDLQIKGQLVAGENKVRIEAKRGSDVNAVALVLYVTEADGLRRRLETDGSWAVVDKADAKGKVANVVHAYDKSPWGDVFAELRPSVTKPESIKVPEGFRVELLHALDEAEGSWVAMCVDGKGRLIASDAGGRMVRITPPPVGGDVKQMKMEPIALPVGHANGLLWAFDSLYVIDRKSTRLNSSHT